MIIKTVRVRKEAQQIYRFIYIYRKFGTKVNKEKKTEQNKINKIKPSKYQ